MESKLKKLPDNNFDRKFDIELNAIRKKKKKTYSICDEIELTIKDNISNLNDMIKAEKDESTNEMYLKIKIEERIYNEFNF